MCSAARVSFHFVVQHQEYRSSVVLRWLKTQRYQADDTPWGCCCAGSHLPSTCDRLTGGQRLCPPCPCIQTPCSCLDFINTTGASGGGPRLHSSRSPRLPLQPMSNPCLLLRHSLSRFCLFTVLHSTRASLLRHKQGLWAASVGIATCPLHTYCFGSEEGSLCAAAEPKTSLETSRR